MPISVRIDLAAGPPIGFWTVEAFSHLDANKNTYWRCRCRCGTVKTVVGIALRQGTSRSCGCLRKIVSSCKRKKIPVPPDVEAARCVGGSRRVKGSRPASR